MHINKRIHNAMVMSEPRLLNELDNTFAQLLSLRHDNKCNRIITEQDLSVFAKLRVSYDDDD